MRLAMIDVDGDGQLAVILDDRAVLLRDLSAEAPASMVDALNLPAPEQELYRIAAERTARGIPLAEVRWRQPIERPGKILCLGLNYQSHVSETGHTVPDYPLIFLRTPDSFVAHGEPLLATPLSPTFDYEAELAVIIGKAAWQVNEAHALDHVCGYSLINDGTIREYQRKAGPQWTIGKNFHRSGSFGPWVVPANALPAGGKGLRLRGILNGETVQDASTSDMIFDVARTIAILSQTIRIEPGDVIASGTPSGVGNARTPKLFMQPGDRFDVEVEHIGRLSNPVAL